MLQKKITTGLALACFVGAFSQDSVSLTAAESKSKPGLSGYIDLYYRYNFANAKNAAGEGELNNFTSFTNSQNSFELGMASVKLEHTAGKVSLVADLGFGKRAQEFSYADEEEGSLLAIKQAFVSYTPTARIKISAGSWATHIGYESVDPQFNRNYSMSYMFSYGPFLHTGVKAEANLGKSDFMLGIANPNDFKSANFQNKMLLAQYSLTLNDAFKLSLNYLGGKVHNALKMRQFDAVATVTLSDKLSVGYNGTVQFKRFWYNGSGFSKASSWWGSALYLNMDPHPGLGFTVRTEYISDDHDLLGFDGNILETTLSANIKIGPLTIIPEARVDNGSRKIFCKTSGEKSESAGTLLLAAIYTF